MILKKLIPVIMIMVILFSFNTISLASQTEDLDSLSKAIKNNKNVLEVLGEEGRKTLDDMTRSLFDVVRIVVSVTITTKLLSLTSDIQKAGEEPDKVVILKSKGKWRLLALLVLINFWSILKFSVSIANKLKLL